MRHSAWLNYLDALETYLQIASESVVLGGSAVPPPSLASRPTEPLPPQLVERALTVLAWIERVTESALLRREQVLVARGALEGRRRVARRVGRRVDWAL